MAFSGASPAGGGILGQGDVGPPLASAFASPGQKALGAAPLRPLGFLFSLGWVSLNACFSLLVEVFILILSSFYIVFCSFFESVIFSRVLKNMVQGYFIFKFPSLCLEESICSVHSLHPGPLLCLCMIGGRPWARVHCRCGVLATASGPSRSFGLQTRGPRGPFLTRTPHLPVSVFPSSLWVGARSLSLCVTAFSAGLRRGQELNGHR